MKVMNLSGIRLVQCISKLATAPLCPVRIEITESGQNSNYINISLRANEGSSREIECKEKTRHMKKMNSLVRLRTLPASPRVR